MKRIMCLIAVILLVFSVDILMASGKEIVILPIALPPIDTKVLDEREGAELAAEADSNFRAILANARRGEKKFKIVSQRNLERILAQQKWSNSDAVSPENRAKFGKLTNADVLLFIQFDRITSTTNQVNIPGGKNAEHTKKVRIPLSIELTHLESGEELDFFQFEGSATDLNNKPANLRSNADLASRALKDLMSKIGTKFPNQIRQAIKEKK